MTKGTKRTVPIVRASLPEKNKRPTRRRSAIFSPATPNNALEIAFKSVYNAFARVKHSCLWASAGVELGAFGLKALFQRCCNQKTARLSSICCFYKKHEHTASLTAQAIWSKSCKNGALNESTRGAADTADIRQLIILSVAFMYRR